MLSKSLTMIEFLYWSR